MVKYIAIFLFSIFLLVCIFKSGQKYGENLIKNKIDKQISEIEKEAIIKSNKDKAELKKRYEKQISSYKNISSQLENCMNSKLDKELIDIIESVK